jgi:hypothetical protein
MKRLQINLTGHVTYGASRSFVIEFADDLPVRTLDREFLETLADEGKIGWEFQAEGFLQSTHSSMEDVDEKTDLPVIQIGNPALDPRIDPSH